MENNPMIQQDRFLRLLEAFDAFNARHKAYKAAFKHARELLGKDNYRAAYGYLAGFDMAQPEHALSFETLEAISQEQAHFKANAKRNARHRAYVQRKKDLQAHYEHKARVTAPKPWTGTNTPPQMPLVITPLSHEEMTALNEAARKMPQYDQEPEHIREVREKMLEAMKRLPEGQSLAIPDEEILGDVDEDFNPFGEG
jgi:hypothetical protein